jgi:ribosomal protein S18 acetylase RimI-like enzyme
MVSVREAGPADVADITALVRVAYARYVPVIGREPTPMGADYAELVAAGTVWVAEVGGADGAIAGVLVLASGADHLLVQNIAVAPDAQGRGIGTRLLELAELEAARAGLAEVRLYTNEAMTENLAYYPRRGYAETGRSGDGGFRRVFFAKRLA